jgi:hypothetical protein
MTSKLVRFYFFLLTVVFSQKVIGQYNYGTVQYIPSAINQKIIVSDEGDLFVGGYSEKVEVYSIQEDGTWSFKQTLTPSDKSSSYPWNWYYGSTLAMHGKNAIVGAQYKRFDVKEEGGVYFYHKGEDGMWYEEQIISPPADANYNYYGGKNLNVYNGKATVSHNNGYPRFVHIYQRQDNGTWIIQDTITDPEFLGIDGQLSHYRDSLFITGVYNYLNQRVKEYQLKPNGEWVNIQTFTDSITNKDTYYGDVLSVDNDWMVLGYNYYSPINEEDKVLNNAGSVHLFQKVNSKWVLKQILTEENPVAYNNFGDYVSIKDDILVVGIPGYKNKEGENVGAISIYKRIENIWTRIQTVYGDAATSSSNFGSGIVIQGEQIIVSDSRGIHIIENKKDCNGVIGGSALLNNCLICYGGTTGIDSLQSVELCLASNTKPQNNIIIKASPNPFDREISVELPLNAQGYVADVTGNIVIHAITNESTNTAHLAPGLYFLIITTEQGRHIIKMMKQ